MGNLAALILRLAVGGLMAGHGAQKLFGSFNGPGIEGTSGFMEMRGLKPGRHGPCRRNLAAEKAHHVRTQKGHQTVMHQLRIKPRQRPSVAEQDVGRPFALEQ